MNNDEVKQLKVGQDENEKKKEKQNRVKKC